MAILYLLKKIHKTNSNNDRFKSKVMSLQHLICNAHSVCCQHLQLNWCKNLKLSTINITFTSTVSNTTYRDNDVDYVSQLEHQKLKLRDKVRQLLSDNKENSKDELWRTYWWAEADLMFQIKLYFLQRSVCFLHSNSFTND